ncbi:MAG TPA: inorganic diphosphatase [Pirellulales bacterium]|nr:inorganic diphosphatase [Pirellulales bacterium]
MSERPDYIEAVIEIPKGSRNKYEYDRATGAIRLDRVLFSSVHYPTDYGFFPGTHAPDGDPLDVMVLTDEPTFPGCHVRVRPIGVLVMRDDKGEDEKILAALLADPRLSGIADISEVNKHLLDEIENFFATYKVLEGKSTEISGWRDSEHAWEIYERCRPNC